jgi:two-component system response regulator DesR
MWIASKTTPNPEGTQMRIVLADDQDRVRHAMRVLLAQQPGIEVVGEATTADNLVAHLRCNCPDLTMLDWELSGLAEAGGLPALRRLCPSLQIVVLSSRPGARQAAQAAGADGFVSKGDPPERLLNAVRRCSVTTRQEA